jgi:hypothetical protein
MFGLDLVNAAVRMYVERRAKSFRQLSLWLHVGKSTLQRWVAAHPVSQQRYASTYRRKSFSEHPFSTAADAVQHLQSLLNVDTSRSTVSRTLRSLRFVRKVPSVSVRPSVPDSPLAAARAAFCLCTTRGCATWCRSTPTRRARRAVILESREVKEQEQEQAGAAQGF